MHEESMCGIRPHRLVRNGWDGTFSGEPQPVGVYVYYLAGEFISGDNFTLKGDFTLVR